MQPDPRQGVPAGDDWLHEVKFDGYRVQVHKVGSRVIIYSRNGHDFTERFPSIAQLLHELPAKAAVVDGEVVASDADGCPNFARCRPHAGVPAAPTQQLGMRRDDWKCEAVLKIKTVSCLPTAHLEDVNTSRAWNLLHQTAF